jgi:hypothetical protein
MAGSYLENDIRGLLGDPGERRGADFHKDVALEGAGSALTEGAVGLIGKGLSKASDFVMGIRGSPKPNAAEIADAAKRLGTTATPGLLSDSPTIQGLESSLSQSPTYAGRQTNKELGSVLNTMQDQAKNVLGGNTGKYASGNEARGLLQDELEQRLAEPKKFYESYNNEVTPFVSSTELQKKAVARNIRELDIANAVQGAPEQQFVNRIADSVENAKDLTQLRAIKKYVGNSMSEAERTGNANLYQTSSAIYGKLAKLEQRTLNRSAVETLGSEAKGTTLAKNMITDLKGANKAYREIMLDVKDIAKGANMGRVPTVGVFQRKLGDVASLPSEKIVDKLFSTDNVDQMTLMANKFPDTFESLRKGKLAQMWQKSLDPHGEVSTAKLLSQVRQMSPESRFLLFGDSAQIVNDLELVHNSMYPKMGPSGTPQGTIFNNFNLLDPGHWADEVKDFGQRQLVGNPDLAARLHKATTIPGKMLSKPGVGQIPRGLIRVLGGDDNE